ncbi:MAG: adenylate/guanylate cyclase domain-containing protein [Gemmatimonadetes bacterium]|nr:adenylate/guanylate cyclase domain-containing protein [Gemmatimonadota bacterium]
MPGHTQYARSGDVHIAWQVVGRGPSDLVLVPGWVSNLDAFWEEPALARFLTRLASFSRLILFDKRGTGLSDRVGDAELPTLEERMDDVRAVMDAAGSQRATLFGYSEGGPMCILFAATHPDRSDALITYGSYAKRIWSPDYPWAPKPAVRQAWLESLESTWGSPVDLEAMAPSVAADPRFREWWAAFLRRSASPSAAVALGRMNTQIDVRHVLPAIRVPALIMHRRGDRDSSWEEGRYIAERIDGARFILLEGDDHLPWIGDAHRVLDEIERFVTGSSPAARADRILASVLFADIVDSTRQAAARGDRGWRELLEAYHDTARRAIEQHRGVLVKTTGDGVLATFDGPARAGRCACAIRDGARTLGLEVRAGVHTGEIERAADGDISGIAVHIASRVLDEAGPGEVWASSTVRDLVAGSGLVFAPRGAHTLRGVPGEWLLFRIESE